MKLRHTYLGLCVLGVVLPYWQFIPWMTTNGLNLSLFISELFSTRIGAFFGLDVVVSALVLLVFVATEGRRLGIWALSLPVLATVVVGVSLGLPLFLYLRQLKLEAAPQVG
jgi:hypothetical protein